jgi:glycosyltransferase involved in cell wall biosynthesis
MKKLTVGYSVLAERVGNMTPPENTAWELLIITQGGESEKRLPAAKHIALSSVGVAKSRNAAIENAQTEYLVFADDDIVFSEKGLKDAIEYLDKNPGVSLLLGSASSPKGELRKRYPDQIQKLNLFNCARAATYEMVIRVADIKRLGIRFDESFGAGAENYLGDEYIFIADLLRAGGRADFVPVILAIHPEVSSGSGWGTERDRVARAKVFSRVFGVLAPVVRLAFGLRRLEELGGIRNLIRFVFGS